MVNLLNNPVKPEDPYEQYNFTKVDTQSQPEFKAVKVADELQGLLRKDNPLMKVTRANAMETANARGIMNSNLAAGSGEKAAIETATPIASQDANSANDLIRNEQAFKFNAAMQDAGDQNKFGLTEMATDQDLRKMEQAQADNLKKMETQQGYTTINRAADVQAEKDLAQDRSVYDQQMQTLVNESKAAIQAADIAANEKLALSERAATLEQQYMSDVTKIMNSSVLTPEQKKVRIAQLKQTYQQQTNIQADLLGYDMPFPNADLPVNPTPGDNTTPEDGGTATETNAGPIESWSLLDSVGGAGGGLGGLGKINSAGHGRL